MRGRIWLAVGATWAVSTLGAGIWFSPAHADASSTSASPSTVADASEAWYDTSESTICSSPVGCPPVSDPFYSYPANTLHVGVSGGSGTSETFVMPDLSAYVGGTLPSAGTMTLPLATVSGNGNSNDSTATIKACLSKALFKDGTAGATSAPPATDCAVTTKLRYANNVFTLDLSPFLAAWSGGTPDYGIALVPDLTGASISTSWQVAFNGKNLSGATPISSSVSGGSASGTTVVSDTVPPTTVAATSAPVVSSSPAPVTSPAATTVAPVSSPADTGNSGASPSLAGVNNSTSPSTALASSGTGASTATGTGGSNGFQYPEVLLLPLLIAGGMLFVLRLLTSDATPKQLRARPIKKEAT